MAGGAKGIPCELTESDLGKLVGKTAGYSGSDMRNLIQEACQGPVRDAITCAGQEEEVANLSEADLRPVNLRDFQVHQPEAPALCADHNVDCRDHVSVLFVDMTCGVPGFEGVLCYCRWLQKHKEHQWSLLK